MEFEFSTFVLEIINLLVLVWLLHRVFYRPVLAIVDRRKAYVEKTLSEAQEIQRQAAELEIQYKHKLEIWQEQRRAAQKVLRSEIDEERVRAMKELGDRLNMEEKKAKAKLERRLAELTHEAESKALELARGFMTQLLDRLTGPDLEAALVRLLLDDLTDLPEEQKARVSGALTAQRKDFTITSAYPLSRDEKRSLQETLSGLAGGKVAPVYHEDSHLIAGIRIDLSQWVIKANLADELSFFYEVAHGQYRRTTKA